MKYEVVMGLEVHAELATESKLFCSCSAKFGAGANENVCPACAGMPGMPAVTNKKAVDLGIAAAIVTNSKIMPVMTFDKKSYFYPDLPAGYQITQWFAPICKDGWVEIETAGGQKRFNLKQIHIEEDAGKLVHDPRTRSSLVDFNRTSVPLVEIVSKPDFRSADEVVAYLEKLRSLLNFAAVSDCKMQEGSMRCDINISVRKTGTEKLGVRTEIKNMNSIKAITRAIEYESQRHIDALETGCETLIQETRRWDDERGETFSMREKETAADYRYFPNPELMPVVIDLDWVGRVRESLPEMSSEKFERMTKRLGLPETESRIITGSRNLSNIFDETLKHFDKPREVVNWIIGDLLSVAKASGIDDDSIGIDCEKFAKVIKLADDRVINRATGKKLLAKVLEDGCDPVEYVKVHGLGVVADAGLLENAIREVLAENEKSVAEYRAGNQKAFGFFVGQVMKKTAGKADPRAVNEMLTRLLGSEV
ncbi:MAG: Asp-tRNA(Asn)/Glu-tRNA(Gln) amidotransferase subunit GatB [Oscillospiraceae bacterium]|jgi:aspartyl-tRNA(Asn)/glutamyl-tRNA(Gln) amidotransferase subunit B|nr:Asp-tRNA(Asn)/Glu-tRNA(Gln) amidotransferase subunit GatB [Oscillospiraceae bacterium]